MALPAGVGVCLAPAGRPSHGGESSSDPAKAQPSGE